MPFDDDPDDERSLPDPLLPPDDRLWRHPSEIGASLGPPTAPPRVRRSPARAALAGACLAGAIVAFGAMWVARPTRVVERELPARTARTAVTTQTASFQTVPAQRLSGQLDGTVARLRVERDGRWIDASALWVDQRGTLAVAAPVVAGATTVLVYGDDRVARVARSAGTDPATGVTAIVVDRTAGVPVLVSDQPLATGDPLAVVGADGSDAAGEGATVSMVVVRSLGRRATVGDHVVHDAIQLDRAVPADAHGGALVDADGALLGMVVGNSTERELGTVVPADDAVDCALALRDHGTVRRAWLGVRAVDLDPDEAGLLGVPGGARITEVTAGSPAAAAGVAVGDVVRAVDQHAIDDASDLVNELADRDPGEAAVLHVRRGTEVLALPLTLGG